MPSRFFRYPLLAVAAVLLGGGAGVLVQPTMADNGPDRLPRWASLAAGKVYLRQGPTYKNRILWVYHRKGLPVRITGQFEVWRKVQMPDGTVGWIHVAMLSARRTVVVTAKTDATIRAQASAHSRILARAQPGVIARLDHCRPKVCAIEVGSIDGWIARTSIWGAGRP